MSDPIAVIARRLLASWRSRAAWTVRADGVPRRCAPRNDGVVAPARRTGRFWSLSSRRAALAIALLLTASTARADDPPPANQELIYKGEATRILGRTVRDPDNNEVGRIVDVLVDDQGMPRAVLIDFGGFMGVGNRRIAVAWRALHFLPAAQQHQIRLDMTVDQIKATPDYKPAPRADAPPVTMAVPPPPPGMPASGK